MRDLFTMHQRQPVSTPSSFAHRIPYPPVNAPPVRGRATLERSWKSVRWWFR